MYVDDSGNSVIRKIGVAAAAQTVAFANVAAKVYGAADFTPAVSASSGLPLTYTSSNTNVATFVNGVVHIVGKGTATLTATQAGNASYLTASASQTLTVTPATLTITANNQSKSAGSINPALTVTYAGFVYGQTQSILTAQPAVSTTATAASAVGTYPIAVSGAVAANYNISYTAGVLTVTVANVGVNKSLAASYVAPGLPAEPKVKQAMSPNGDGINDVLVIDNIESYPDNKVSLMDNSGVMVFVTSGYDNANRVFTGRSNKTGAMLKAGTYYYVLEYHDNGEAKRKTGFFIIKY
jgi:gliding motility-associated-like protein